ncbi:hypothetical protein [Paraburkholderia aspalathi]|uniref:hypothetical protein n=1 Tax=Paraburkholderia aspalathi TaxID=1324617 RepID=UPI003CA40BB6
MAHRLHGFDRLKSTLNRPSRNPKAAIGRGIVGSPHFEITCTMAKSDLIGAAIEFVDWEKPWTFYSAVLNHLSLESDDRAALEDVWAEACRPEYWRDADISKCCDACDHGLRNGFSWLPDDARAQFVRAASFQWK